VFHDLRTLYSEIEIKVSEPFVCLTETVADSSSVKCFSETPNKKNTIEMVAEPLDKGLSDEIEKGIVNVYDSRQVESRLVEKFGWDELTAASVWCFGPNRSGPNMLIDYSLESETDKQMLSNVRESIVQGFQWATREGPLCEESIRNAKFKILGGNFASEPIYRSGGQIIPTSRRVVYSSFLLAQPKIMEPTLLAEIYTPKDCIEAIYNVNLYPYLVDFAEETSAHNFRRAKAWLSSLHPLSRNPSYRVIWV